MPAASLAQIVLFADDWGHMDFDNGWWIVMGIGMILFWGLVILGVIWLVRELAHPRGDLGRGGGDHAREILDRRLAEGEITVVEYEERRRTLQRSG
jgi:putative membrane protein